MSDEAVAAFSRAVLDEVEGHYAQSQDQPLFLSMLGKRVGRPAPLGMTLRAFIERFLGETLSLVIDPNVRERIAVVPLADARRVRTLLASKTGLQQFPRALIVAFCRPLADNQRVFYAVRGKPRFRLSEEELEAPFVEIEPEFRLALDARRVDTLSTDEQQKLFSSIQSWGTKHRIALSELRTVERQAEPSAPAGTALDRLLDAQNPEILPKLLIPGDIARILRREK